MVAPMSLFGGSFFIGRIFNINVRVHFTLLLMFVFWIQRYSEIWIGVVIGLGFFLSILLHEFGHSLACKLFKGDADEILMWPLGGLAFCRPPHHPTAHFVTTICGPLVTLVLWLLLWFASPHFFPKTSHSLAIARELGSMNLFLLIFNLLPSFPMDGGRIVRDSLWHVIGFANATKIAVWAGRITGALMILVGLGVVSVPFFAENLFMTIIGALVLYSNWDMERVLAAEGAGQSGYSIKAAWKHSKRQKKFRSQMASQTDVTLHECKKCGRTDVSDPELVFRVSGVDGEEYCEDHLPSK